IEVVAPHVNHSTNDFESDGAKIYLPLSVVKYLGENGARAIMQERPFKDAKDFMSRVPKRLVPARARLGLYELGAFDGLTPTPAELEVKPVGMASIRERQEEYMGIYLPEADFLR